MTTLNAEHMRAAFIRGAGPADSIVVGDVPIPRPGPGSVLVHNSVMAVNHVDTFIRSGAYATPLPGGTPFIVGRDLAGTVVEVGSGVAGFAAGDAVWCNSLGYDGRHGSFSDYSVVPAERLYPLPAGVTPESVAAVAHTAATAYLGLVREASLRVGETVFIGGAAGGVGAAAVQLAHAAGARVLASCAPHDATWVRSCGADEVFDRTDAALLDRVYASAPSGVDVWWDTTGRLELAGALRLVARGGRVIVSAGLAGPGRAVDPTDFYTRDIQVRGFAISNASVADLAAGASAINSLLARGKLKGRVAKVLTLEEAAGAHRLMESHAAPGKLLVKPGSAHPKPHKPGTPGAGSGTGTGTGSGSSTGSGSGPASGPASASTTSGSGTAPKPNAAPKPGTAPKPAAAPKFGATPKPSTEPKPNAAPKPGAAPKPNAVPKTDVAPKPNAVPKPSTSPNPNAEPKPGAAPKPGAVAHSGTSPDPSADALLAAPSDAAPSKPTKPAPTPKPGSAAGSHAATSATPHPAIPHPAAPKPGPKPTLHTTESAPQAPSPKLRP